MTKFLDSFSEEVWAGTYKDHTDTGVNGTHGRNAKGLASVEKDPEYWEKQFTEVMQDFKTVPGGRIVANAGAGHDGASLINCVVSAPGGDDIDSLDGILRELKNQALTLKSECGYGFNADFIRPKGAFIKGVGIETCGMVKWLEVWDKQSEVITQGSGEKKKTKEGKAKARKGAQMVVSTVKSPEIEGFIKAKQVPGKLSKFNMSVGCFDEFMDAVENHKPWDLEFPEIEHPQYKKEWDGNIKVWKGKGYPTKVYHTYKDANELWDVLMKATYTRNEPGVLFIDRINHWNNLYYCEYISASNPCGEQVLPANSSCLLGSLNLTQYIDFNAKNWDYAKLKKDIPIFVRLLDNVNDISYMPLELQRQNLKDKRRIGIGYMGYASALFMLKIKYGSEEALKMTRELVHYVTNECYRASALLAKEKGAFPLFDKEKYLNSNFIKARIDDDVKTLIAEYGIRNSHLTSIQPTGNSSSYANIVSGGLEPIFNPEFVRTAIQAAPPEGLLVPTVDWTNKKLLDDITNTWSWAREGDEDLVITKFEGAVYKIDRTRGLLKETWCKDFAVRFLEEKGEWDPKSPWAATAMALSLDDHIKTMQVFSEYCDAAISKTINLPNDFPYEDFKRVYMDVYKTGTIKGCTTYRAGTMASVLATESTLGNNQAPTTLHKNQAPKRPKKLPCDIHHMTANGEKFLVVVGLLDKDPYEAFAVPNGSKGDEMFGPVTDKSGYLVKVKQGKYDLHLEDRVIEDIAKYCANDEQAVISRMISTSLRHGADIKFICDQLGKGEGSVVSFSKCIARTLKKYITSTEGMKCKECGSKNIILSEGCFKCNDCAASKCG